MNAFFKHLFPDAEKYEVWAKGHIVPGLDLLVWRKDDFGNLMRFHDHGNRASDYGWEIDHILPTVLGGSDLAANKRPLHWRVNASAGGLIGALMGNAFRDR